MTERLATRYTIALEGFGDDDRPALARFFELAAGRAPAYEPADTLHQADFVLADAGHATAVAAVGAAGRLGDTVFVGAAAPAGAVSRLDRPIIAADLVRELDALLERRLAGFDAPAPGDWVMADRGVQAGKPGVRDVLVVDDSRVALKFLQVRLQGLGYRVHLAQTAEQALRLLGTQPFSLVFLDVVLAPGDGMDGLALCQLIKQRKSHPGGVVPRVLMVTGLASSSDRVRGDLAGCDAYLTKPLMEPAFLEALRLLAPVALPA